MTVKKPVDLGQTPADVVVSAADTELAACLHAANRRHCGWPA
jgi:hypothetical protein